MSLGRKYFAAATEFPAFACQGCSSSCILFWATATLCFMLQTAAATAALRILPLLQAKYLAAATNKEEEDIMRDFSRPRYFNPFEAAEYGLIDQVCVLQQACCNCKCLQQFLLWPWSLWGVGHRCMN
eukprot:GHRR01034902.1.p2 GENE.GHRR01034902.1~~GHRR01034902.1.p2  ORF type:complete len:127 (+),score=30.56 GHRR01034902.1:340-720(+)